MNLEIKTSTGTLRIKPVKLKHLNRLTELLDSIEYENTREEVEEECLINLIGNRFVTSLDESAFWTMLGKERKETLKEWRECSQIHYDFISALKEMEDDPQNTDRKPSEPSVSSSKVSPGREFIQKILNPYKRK
jgi:hypothetical protein